MDSSQVCRICLAHDTPLITMENILLQDFYTNITKKPYDLKDGRKTVVCHICCHLLKKCHRFAQSAAKADEALQLIFEAQAPMTDELLSKIRKPFLLTTFQKSPVTNVNVARADVHDVTIVKREEEEELLSVERTDGPEAESDPLNIDWTDDVQGNTATIENIDIPKDVEVKKDKELEMRGTEEDNNHNSDEDVHLGKSRRLEKNFETVNKGSILDKIRQAMDATEDINSPTNIELKEESEVHIIEIQEEEDRFTLEDTSQYHHSSDSDDVPDENVTLEKNNVSAEKDSFIEEAGQTSTGTCAGLPVSTMTKEGVKSVHKKKNSEKLNTSDAKVSRNISTLEKNRIIELHEEGLNVTKISRALRLTRNTVRRWIRRYEDEGHLDTRPPQPRNRFILSKEQTVDPFTPALTFAQQFESSLRTVSRTLLRPAVRKKPVQKNPVQKKPVQKVVLSDRDKVARVKFAREFRDFDFSHAIFAGEKCFEELKTKVDSDILSFCTMCGWMTASGPGELVEITERINAHSYLELLKESLVPTARVVYPQSEVRELIFLQDSSRIHNASVVQDWLQAQTDIRTIRLPPRSPDLNPMENLWGIMVQRWENKKVREAFVPHCNTVWESLRGSDVCEELVFSMRSRLDAVIKANGAATTN